MLWCSLYGILTFILVSLDIDSANATWSPHVHPQSPHQSVLQYAGSDNNGQHYHHHSQQSTNTAPVRGGSTATVYQQHQQHQQYQQQSEQPNLSTEEELMIQNEQQYYQSPYSYSSDNEQQSQEQHSTTRTLAFHIPKIQLKHVSMALRLTSEWNRRLLNGINRLKHWGRGKKLHSGSEQQSSSYGDVPVNVHPSRTWQPPITSSNGLMDDDDELTVFHAKTPARRSNSDVTPRGVCYWGPDLLDYLHELANILGVITVDDDVSDNISNNGVEIPLAMIYMDRACSVETPRSNGILPCPYCTPQTVHRLCLAAFLMAIEAVHGEERMREVSMKLLSASSSSSSPALSLDIPLEELQQMVDWMRGALGDIGQVVTLEHMMEWTKSWESIFSPDR
jgi:hypothetical protein